MPPKKKARSQEVRSAFLNLLPDEISPTFCPQDLSRDELLTAYGLANLPSGSSHGRCCPNKWKEDAQPDIEVKGKGKAKAAEVETLVLEDSEDDFKPKGKKPSDKGKGKAKELPCSPDNCSGNPRCLNWLGQAKWEDTDKAMAAFRKAAGIGDDPSNDRVPDVPVGLKNLGATCYVNSLLQVWYRDLTFRAGVYACHPPSSGNVDASPLFQLQVLFAFLQTSAQGTYDPEPLVTALNLDKTEQQDSQEFSKLFLSLLDHEFKKQASRAADEGIHGPPEIKIATLVQDQFEGSITYGTLCEKCKTRSERKSTFLEVEISLTKNCKLEDRIAESLQEEHMEGDNQYFCESCDQKRDAVRYSRLEALPPVLHFSLLRFVFNMKDFSRSKSNHAISYPLKLDMGSYLPEGPDGKHPELWYDLKGVLMHKGQSAHHGHYVAQVQDATQGKWFLFDDTAVSELSDLNAPDHYDQAENGEGVKEKAKPKKPKAGFTLDDKGEILPKSKDAYMLIYTRRDHVDQPVSTDPPPLAQMRVEQLDAAHQAGKDAFMKEEEIVKADFEIARQAKRSVYRVWDEGFDNDEAYCISKDALRRWLEHGVNPKKPTAKLPEEDCATPLEKEGVVVNQNDLVGEIALTMGNGDTLEAAPTNGTCAIGEPAKEDTPSSDVHIAEKPWDPKRLDSSDILCRHGNIDPQRSDRMKVISQAGMKAFGDSQTIAEPSLMLANSLCRECVWEIAADKLYEQQHQVHTATVRQARGQDADEGIWVPKAWLNDWLKEVPRMHTSGSLSDPYPEENPTYSADVRCPHDGLNPDGKRREFIGSEGAAVLQSLYPAWKALDGSSNICEVCDEEKEAENANEKALKSVITAESKLLSRAMDATTQSVIGGSAFCVLEDKNYFIIPKSFAHGWTLWAKGKGKRPGSLDNTPFICHHGRFAINVERESRSPKNIAIMGEKEWKLLQKSYDAGPPIKLWKDNDDELATSPGTCAECLDAQRNDFTESWIKLRKLRSDDFEEDGSRKKKDVASSPELEIMPAAKGPTKTYGVRTSKRVRDKPKVKAEREFMKLELFKGDTVKDLRIRINDKFRIPTIYQRLFFQGRELESEETAETIGLRPLDWLELYEIEVDEDINLKKLDDSVPERDRKRGRSEGFGGTGLSGWETFEGMDMEADRKEASSTDAAGDIGVSCPVCTFVQAPQAKCELCDADLGC